MKLLVIAGIVFASLVGEAYSQCNCDNRYIPFCGTDGVTYSNRCSLDCARSRVPGLGVKFEGVCAEPYKPNGDAGTRGSGSNYPTTRPPPYNYRPTTPPYRPPTPPPYNYRPSTPPPYRPPPTPPPYRPPTTTQPPYYRPSTPYYPTTTQPPYYRPSTYPPSRPIPRPTTAKPYWAPNIYT